jgi:hypothetical protein
VGALGSFGNLLGLLNSPNIIDVIFTFIKLCVYFSILYVGLTLKKTLLKSPEIIQIILIIPTDGKESRYQDQKVNQSCAKQLGIGIETRYKKKQFSDIKVLFVSNK